MIIYLGADHAGFALKEEVKIWLKEEGYQVQDEGAFQLEPTDDYPDFVSIVAKEVAAEPVESRGLVFGGSGQGEAIAANRFIGVRAAVYYGGSQQVITWSREHNNANVLSLGARLINLEEAKAAIKLWLETNFTGEDRHIRRIKKIDWLEHNTTNEF